MSTTAAAVGAAAATAAPILLDLGKLGYSIYQDQRNHNFALDESERLQNNWKKEFQFSKDQFQYMQQQNDLTREREDTAITRKVNDLVNAGLNPVLAAGGQAAPAQVMSSTHHGSGSSSSVASAMVQLQQVRALAEIENIKADTNLKNKDAGVSEEKAITENWSRGHGDQVIEIGKDANEIDRNRLELERKKQEYYESLSAEQLRHEQEKHRNEMNALYKQIGLNERDVATREFLANLKDNIDWYYAVANDRNVDREDAKFEIYKSISEGQIKIDEATLNALMQELKLDRQENVRQWIKTVAGTILGIWDAGTSTVELITRPKGGHRPSSTQSSWRQWR